jgi:hypothetical protein
MLLILIGLLSQFNIPTTPGQVTIFGRAKLHLRFANAAR